MPPTEIVVDISTDANCSDMQGVTIAVGEASKIDDAVPFPASSSCSDGSIGRVVVVPGSLDANVGIRVVGGFKRDVTTCVDPYGEGCIVARRALKYVPHTPLYLPIKLQVSCSGVPCDTTSTCVDGKCVPSNIGDPTGCKDPDGGCAPSGGLGPECGDVSGAEPGASWPMTGLCPTHTSRTPYGGPVAQPTTLWQYQDQTPSPQYSMPFVTADGTTIFGTASGNVVAYDATTNAMKWLIATGTAALDGNGGILADGTFVIPGTSAIYDFDLGNQQQKWATNQHGTDIVIGAQVLYQGSQGFFHALDPSSGKDLWTTPTKAAGTATFNAPAISPDGSRVYLSADDGYFGIVDTTSHAEILGTTFSGNGLPMAVADRVYLPAKPLLFAYDKDGKQLWSYQVITSGVALAKDGTVVVGTAGHIGGVDASGAPTWSVAIPADVTSDIVIDGGGIIYGITAASDILAIDPKSGVRWSVNVATAMNIAVTANKTVLVITNDGRVVALR